VARRLVLIEDDLMFAQRARAAAARLQVPLESLRAGDVPGRVWQGDEVALLQATLRPERQLALVESLIASRPAPRVVAVTGHLETALRDRLRRLGARLATNSSMDRPLARALEISGDDAGGRDASSPSH
jgi:ActR/RegA family two-component response regulator